jgi:hypothetical protein
LFNRLEFFLENNNIICPEQIGFKRPDIISVQLKQKCLSINSVKSLFQVYKTSKKIFVIFEKFINKFIKPLFKGGSTNDPSCYRGIAISSCLSKLFTRILFNRLEFFLENNNIICPEQIGFKRGARTVFSPSRRIFS